MNIEQLKAKMAELRELATDSDGSVVVGAKTMLVICDLFDSVLEMTIEIDHALGEETEH